jgi:exoribonuclease R
VDPETGAVLQRETHCVPGILALNTRANQGFTARKVPLYLFYPLEGGYPPFVVSSKLTTKENLFAVATFEHWDDKWPRGGIQRVLGPVDVLEVQEKALLLRASVSPSVVDNTIPVPDLSKHVGGDWDTVVHIDPDGCEDVDDILCLKRVDDGWDLGIGIADVSAWIPEGCSLDIDARAKGQTLYVNGDARVPMFPTSISASAASLRADGVERPVVMLRIAVRGGAVVSRTWGLERVVVGVSHTYETVLEDGVLSGVLPEVLGVAWGSSVGADSHHWIEVAMILYNTAVAELLRREGAGLLRAHAGVTRPEWVALAERTGCPDVAMFGMSKGVYVDAKTTDCAHAGLGLDVYCHASSPLRRYADLVNQRCLKAILFGGVLPSASASASSMLPVQLNERSRVAKQLERDLWYATHLRSDRVSEAEGIVVEAKGADLWNVYVPAWKRVLRCRQTDPCTIGSNVLVRAYVDLTTTQWDRRAVCSISIVQEVTGTL